MDKYDLQKDEKGNIVSAMVGEGFNYRKLYVYRWLESYHAWTKLDSVPKSTFYRGIKKGYIKLL